MNDGTRLGASASVVLMGWLTLVLILDANGSLALQRALGLLTWAVLLLALQRASPVVRAQTVVVVVFATAVEFLCSPLLGVYLYRFDNVPMYVPPGHGLVYLSAFALGHAAWVRGNLRAFTVIALAGLGTWSAYGVFLAGRPDLLGGLWLLCLVGFVRWGPSTEVYVGAAAVVTYLELVGTHLANWVWQPQDPTGLVSIGNPPTGAAGGYGWFDLAALLAAPYLLSCWRVLRLTRRAPLAPLAPLAADES